MAKSLGVFRAALLIGWAALCVAGLLYARFKGIPTWAALPVLAAFLIEYPFYLLPGFPELHKRPAGKHLPVFLIVSAILPYAACCAGAIKPVPLFKLGAFAVIASSWYAVLPIMLATDLGYLAFLGATLLSGFFESIYPSPYRALQTAILGRLALFHIAVLVLLLQRGVKDTGYGFWPNRREWRIGTLHYLFFLPAAACLALPLRTVHLVSPAPAWKTVGVFFGFFWVVALFEEFIFRGVLQQWIEDWTWNRTAALVLTSAIFGMLHLWFRGFPNWRWALLAALLGLFCGHARNQAGSIRASVVTHALVVATWRGFFG